MKHIFYKSLIITFLFTGCGTQKTVIKRFYTLEQTDKLNINRLNDTVQINARCEVEDVFVYPAYSTRKIVFRDASHQIRYFEDHEWAVHPSEVLTRMTIDFLSAQNLFLKVSNRFWKHTPKYHVNTTIYKMEVVPTENRKNFTAHLEINFQLTDAKTGLAIVNHFANRESELETKNLNLLAESISNLFYEELEKFATKIKDELSNREIGE
ncbi:ABC-type transport auxiliary lipoprotein family protein [Thermophagus xiamenensis]|uniref:ABC-type transport auxiliary lipoprotein component n=1 Tax=Thermophagus xiamenensis TaxID=385682 RepID=A0A1I1Z0G0_9BACT|nr:ABC-type transport auxiliary lipoprotein family protein [Thermophagus xiamenensis]SFE23913.1 ABC-type transport auxiliary lipoprotein component [Thermophagus xiamenensis]